MKEIEFFFYLEEHLGECHGEFQYKLLTSRTKCYIIVNNSQEETFLFRPNK